MQSPVVNSLHIGYHMWPILKLNCWSQSKLTGSFYSTTGSQQAPIVTQGQSLFYWLEQYTCWNSILLALKMHGEKCWEKSYKCLHMPTILAFLSQASRAYSSLSRKLHGAVYEVSTVLVLRLRITLQEWTKQNVCHPCTKGPTVIQDFTMAKLLSILTWKYSKLLIYCHGEQQELSLSTSQTWWHISR